MKIEVTQEALDSVKAELLIVNYFKEEVKDSMLITQIMDDCQHLFTIQDLTPTSDTYFMTPTS